MFNHFLARFEGGPMDDETKELPSAQAVFWIERLAETPITDEPKRLIEAKIKTQRGSYMLVRSAANPMLGTRELTYQWTGWKE